MQSKLKRNFRYGLATYIFIIGMARLIPEVTTFLVNGMPSYLPWQVELVYLSGAIEVVLAIMLLFPKTMRLAGWLLIALYLAVLPAHYELYFKFRPFEVELYNDLIHLVRNLFQIVYIIWTYWCTKTDSELIKKAGLAKSSIG